MASGRDVRDLLGLPVGGEVQKPAQKRSKPSGGARKIQGVAREVAALYGERPPPVAVYEEKKSYRAKRQNAGPAKKWIRQPFTNPARADGLELRHWRRKPTAQPALTNGEDVTMEDSDAVEVPVETNYEFAKYNVDIEVPTFTDEEYDAYLRNDDWSREETDYLLEMVKEYYYRWAVIYDRYDYKPSAPLDPFSQDSVTANGDQQALATLPFAPPKTRTVEDLKARFYSISASLMKLRIPEVQMDADQYARYEILSKFDPLLEKTRKNLAAALMNRSIDEVKEEEFLLAELQRINMAANRLDAEREELRARLEAPAQNNQLAAGLASFQSSQALAALFSQLFQQDRSKKRGASGGGSAGPARLSISGADLMNTPTSAHHNGSMSAANRRQSMAQPTAQTPIRSLSPQNELRFNVSTHERLTSGITFGSDKLLKMRQAKSGVQTSKIAAALAELGIAELISIPTAKVGDVFEQLIGKVGKLLDVRKVREKEEGECRVLEAMKARRASESQPPNLDGTGESNPSPEKEIPDSQEDGDEDADADEADGNGDADADGEVDEDADGDDDADGEGEDDSAAQTRQASESVSTRAVSAGHKRSASVLSQASGQSTKRVRK